MTLPFSQEQFLAVFATYNSAIWPIQIIAVLLGGISIVLLFWQCFWSSRAISGILALFWAFMGVIYHWSYFAKVNSAAFLFGALFLVAALIFLFEGTIRNRIHFAWNSRSAFSWLAGLLALYGLVAYPLLGLLVTHPYPQTPLFGVAPCPTTIFTFSLLLVMRHQYPWMIALVPLIWAIIGGSAAVLLGITQDLGLIVAAVLWVAGTISLKRV